MATILEEVRWKKFLNRYYGLLQYGIKHGFVKAYDNELLMRLRDVNYGGLSASILVLHRKLADGHCYDRSVLITTGFGDDNFRIVGASVNSLSFSPYFIDKYRSGKLSEFYGEHSFAERLEADGRVWVYDTSLGFAVERNLYYAMENPIISNIRSREETISFLRNDFLDDSDLDRDKYALPIILPGLEACLIPIQDCYKKRLEDEIGYLKERVNYDDICREVDEDMRRVGLR